MTGPHFTLHEVTERVTASALDEARGGPSCGRCEADYCACHDFYSSRVAFWRGEYDHLRKERS